ncbi:MAG: alpha/beta hydrolase [Candidatus Andersenbacteria bacterium]
MSTPTLVAFTTADGITLPGLLYRAKRRKRVAIYLHGNGSSSVFYDEHTHRAVADALTKRNISYLTFNNRGAHLIKKLNVVQRGQVKRKCFGMAYEKIRDCVHDIDAAIAFLRHEGYREFSLVGSSTGANKICVYDHYRPKNRISTYILLAGGDDTGIYYNLLGKKPFNRLLKQAKQKIRQRQAENIIPEILPKPIFSYSAFYDIANPDGDYNCFPFLEVLRPVKLSRKPLFRYFKAIRKPSLVIYGEKDEYTWGDTLAIVAILRERQPEFTYKIIPDADHMFAGHEQELGKIMATWLSKQ